MECTTIALAFLLPYSARHVSMTKNCQGEGMSTRGDFWEMREG